MHMVAEQRGSHLWRGVGMCRLTALLQEATKCRACHQLLQQLGAAERYVAQLRGLTRPLVWAELELLATLHTDPVDSEIAAYIVEMAAGPGPLQTLAQTAACRMSRSTGSCLVLVRSRCANPVAPVASVAPFA
jgi:hypothetical protein